jgi:P27 family predicted phage terminase small subunit
MPGTSKSGRTRTAPDLNNLRGNPGGRKQSDALRFSGFKKIPKPTSAIKSPRKPKPTGDIKVDTAQSFIYEEEKYKAGIATAEWKRLAPELHEKGLLTKAGLRFFEIYCRAYSIYVYAIKKQSEIDGITEKGKRIFHHDYSKMEKDSTNIMRWVGSELGLTPLSSLRVKARPKEKEISDAGSYMDKVKKLYQVK